MNRFLLGAALLLVTSAPVLAQDLRSSANTFCGAIRKLNAQGLSGAPGGFAASMIASQANQTATQYRQAWQISKALGIPACKAMW